MTALQTMLTYIFFDYREECILETNQITVCLLTGGIITIGQFHLGSILVHLEWIVTLHVYLISTSVFIKVNRFFFHSCTFDLLASSATQGVQVERFVERQRDSIGEFTWETENIQ